METTLLLVRHGESEANLQKRFAGSWDVALTQKGLAQADLTAKYISEKYKVDKIYSSDLQRAYKTAEAISKLTGKEIVTDKGLREIYAGEWEKKTFNELIELFPDTFVKVWRKDIGNAVADGGESVAQVGVRVYSFLEKVARDNEGKTIVIATHATPIRTALCLIKGKGIEEAKNLEWVTNASITEVKYINGRWEIVDFSHDSHLDSAKTTLPPTV